MTIISWSRSTRRPHFSLCFFSMVRLEFLVMIFTAFLTWSELVELAVGMLWVWSIGLVCASGVGPLLHVISDQTWGGSDFFRVHRWWDKRTSQMQNMAQKPCTMIYRWNRKSVISMLVSYLIKIYRVFNHSTVNTEFLYGHVSKLSVFGWLITHFNLLPQMPEDRS